MISSFSSPFIPYLLSVTHVADFLPVWRIPYGIWEDLIHQAQIPGKNPGEEEHIETVWEDCNLPDSPVQQTVSIQMKYFRRENDQVPLM